MPNNLSLIARYVPRNEVWVPRVKQAVNDGGYGDVVTFDDDFRVSILTRREIERLPRVITANKSAIRAILARLIGERPTELRFGTGRLTFQAPDMLMLELSDDDAGIQEDTDAVYGAFGDELGRPVPNRSTRGADQLLYLGRISGKNIGLIDDIEAVALPTIPREVMVGAIAMKGSSGGAWVDL